MARDKVEQRIPRKEGKGGGSSGQAKPGSKDPIDNIFRNRNDGLDDSDDEDTDYNFRMDGGPTAGTTGMTTGTTGTTASAANAAGTTTGTASTTADGAVATALAASRDPMVQMFWRIGFEMDVADIIVTKEHVSSIDTLAELDDSACENIIKGIRKMKRPDNNPEPYSVAYLAARNFQTAAFMAKHYDRISRVLNPSDVRPGLFPGYQIQRELEDREISQKALPLPTDLSFDNPLKAAKTIETLVEHLGRHRGITGVPLSYVVRDNLHPTPAWDDPLPATARGSKHLSHDSEMVARAPITKNERGDAVAGPFHPAFMQDMVKVWQILHDIFHEQPIWIHTKPSALARNGRACFFAITDYVMGKEAAEQMELRITASLSALKYNGSKTKNWNFEKYCNKHIELHNQYEPLTRKGRPPLSEAMKVHHVITNIGPDSGFDAC